MRSSRPRIPLRLSLALVALHILLAGPCQPADITGVPSPERRLAVPITTAVAPDARFTPIRTELIESVRRGKFPSISIAVIDDGKTVWEESIGWSDREQHVAATRSTAYLLASLGKSVTASAVMRLVDQHRIDLAAPIDRYFGDAALTMHAGDRSAVTVARVLDMTAEIPHGGLSFLSEKDANAYTSSTLVRNRGIVVFPPGTIAMYSNMNYGIVEQMLATVSGRSFRSFMHEVFFAPLGMQHSWVGPNRAGGARHYSSDGKLLPPTFNRPESSLAMYMSLDDLVRYARMHLDLARPRYLQPDTLKMMQTHSSGVEHAPLALGIGNIGLSDGSQFLLTNGRAGGAQSTLGMFPRQRSAVICLINATGGASDDIAFRIADLLHPGFAREIHDKIAEHEAWADHPYAPGADDYGTWRGTIENRATTLPIELEFQRDGDVHVRIAKQPETLVKLAFHDGLISGRFIAEVPAEIEPGHAHPVTISLLRSGDRLSGFLTSGFENERGSFSLASYVTLSKAP